MRDAADRQPSVVGVQTPDPSDVTRVECGKICSYDYDAKEHTEFYPLLRKRVNCANILRRMENPPHRVVRPPPRHPPADLLDSYTQGGECPLGSDWYIDESANAKPYNYSAEHFRALLARDNASAVINPYRDSGALGATLWKYAEETIRDRRAVVIGTQKPWAEAISSTEARGR